MNKRFLKADDIRLVNRARNGDREAMDELVRKYTDTAWRYAYRLCPNEDDAADLVAEAFARVYTGLESYKEKSSFSTWLYRIVVNCFLDRKKRERRHQHASLEAEIELEDGEVTLQIPDDALGPDEELEGAERSEILARAINLLPEKHKAMVILYHVEMLGYEEIAAVMGLPVGTVKSRLNRARLALKEILAPHVELFVE
ncbi:MAG: RNA polymerase sigma factor RpoE [Fimbriimonadales bacterium]|jgi:RNA polymerase sigma-70 factor (ECF subfamily)|nr:MAG: RNA polymerase sigma factor RpoE [Fimbriimonadales bacterium]